MKVIVIYWGGKNEFENKFQLEMVVKLPSKV